MRHISVIILMLAFVTGLCVAHAYPIVSAIGATNDSSDRFQSVSGDFARSWLTDLNNTTAATAKTAASNNSLYQDLWSWGNLPKGKKLVDGELVNANYTEWKLVPYPYIDWLDTSMQSRPLVLPTSKEWIPPF